MHEADILSKLNHAHVVAFLPVADRKLRYHESFLDENGDHLCIVTDHCAVCGTTTADSQNGTLADVIRDVRLRGQVIPEQRIMEWTVQIAQALQYIHSCRILHRDLKTANIFLTKNDIIKACPRCPR